jgi:hypothetical protein
MFKSSQKQILFSLIIFTLTFLTVIPANATSAIITPLSEVSPGTIVTFSEKQWIVVDPISGYLITKESQGKRAFDPDRTHTFNPGDSNNIAYWLNNDFYNSLTKNKEWIIDRTWDLDSHDEQYATCKIGLLSTGEWHSYGEYIDGLTSVDGSPTTMFWTRELYPFYEPRVYSIKPLSDEIYVDYAYQERDVHPTLHLKSGLYFVRSQSNGQAGTIIENTGTITMGMLSDEIKNKLNSIDAAKSSADSAAINATNANINASSAKSEAIAAKNAANTASSRVWDNSEGKSAATLSKEARDRANASAVDADYIRNTQ